MHEVVDPNLVGRSMMEGSNQVVITIKDDKEGPVERCRPTSATTSGVGAREKLSIALDMLR